jgi:excisionase family DNA binding protein
MRKGNTMSRRLYSVQEAMARTGLGRSNLFNKLAAGEIRSVKVGKRRLIPDTAIDEYIVGLEEAARVSSGVA